MMIATQYAGQLDGGGDGLNEEDREWMIIAENGELKHQLDKLKRELQIASGTISMQKEEEMHICEIQQRHSKDVRTDYEDKIKDNELRNATMVNKQPPQVHPPLPATIAVPSVGGRGVRPVVQPVIKSEPMSQIHPVATQPQQRHSVRDSTLLDSLLQLLKTQRREVVLSALRILLLMQDINNTEQLNISSFETDSAAAGRMASMRDVVDCIKQQMAYRDARSRMFSEKILAYIGPSVNPWPAYRDITPELFNECLSARCRYVRAAVVDCMSRAIVGDFAPFLSTRVKCAFNSSLYWPFLNSIALQLCTTRTCHPTDNTMQDTVTDTNYDERFSQVYLIVNDEDSTLHLPDATKSATTIPCKCFRCLIENNGTSVAQCPFSSDVTSSNEWTAGTWSWCRDWNLEGSGTFENDNDSISSCLVLLWTNVVHFFATLSIPEGGTELIFGCCGENSTRLYLITPIHCMAYWVSRISAHPELLFPSNKIGCQHVFDTPKDKVMDANGVLPGVQDSDDDCVLDPDARDYDDNIDGDDTAMVDSVLGDLSGVSRDTSDLLWTALREAVCLLLTLCKACAIDSKSQVGRCGAAALDQCRGLMLSAASNLQSLPTRYMNVMASTSHYDVCDECYASRNGMTSALPSSCPWLSRHRELVTMERMSIDIMKHFNQ